MKSTPMTFAFIAINMLSSAAHARYYDPATGRFISEDPIGFDAGVNFYAYVENNPVNNSDPSGLEPGDIYNFRPNDAAARITARLGGGPYSHQAIELSGGRILEAVADGGGVRILPMAQVLAGRDYDVFRSNRGVTQAKIDRLDSFALNAVKSAKGSFLEGGYDLSAFLGKPNTDGAQYICSTLCRDAARYSGLGRISGDRTPLKTLFFDFINPTIPTSPNDILNSKDFYKAPSIQVDVLGFGDGLSSAGGGFLLYPNKANTNMTRSVYAK